MLFTLPAQAELALGADNKLLHVVSVVQDGKDFLRFSLLDIAKDGNTGTQTWSKSLPEDKVRKWVATERENYLLGQNSRKTIRMLAASTVAGLFSYASFLPHVPLFVTLPAIAGSLYWLRENHIIYQQNLINFMQTTELVANEYPERVMHVESAEKLAFRIAVISNQIECDSRLEKL